MTCIIYQHAHNEHIQRELETIQTKQPSARS
jgi:hypothetical protein